MIGGIILAAGSSRRFGDDKRKVELPSGRTVLEQSIRNAADVLQQVMVVLRFGDQPFIDEFEPRLDLPNVEFFRAPDSAKGMAHSLGNAVHELHDWDAAMILLGDMPYLKSDTLRALLDAYQANQAKAPIVLPSKDGKTGHPVIFAARYFEEIEALMGDVGARAVVDAHPDAVITVAVSDPGIFRDIDTPEDL
ncbi:MAG TPA: nucleotidyltransferase family protein [Pseudomonadales bacterium]|nr:nucleotidyltransferase family protein [Pseudomonadales bacterium]